MYLSTGLTFRKYSTGKRILHPRLAVSTSFALAVQPVTQLSVVLYHSSSFLFLNIAGKHVADIYGADQDHARNLFKSTSA